MSYYNTQLYIVLLTLSFLVGKRLKLNVILSSILVYILLFFSLDVLEYKFDVKIWDQTERTSNCYDWFEQYLEKDYDRNKDYSEGVFEDNYKMSLQEATENKYKYVFEKLELKPGMKLLDAGCGTGVWMKYCKDRGVDVIGLTLSEEQAKKVKEKGLEVYVMDYRKFNPSFVNTFDRITALGSSEHVCKSQGSMTGNFSKAKERCIDQRIKTWNIFNQYLKPKNETKDGYKAKAYITMLTSNQNAKWSIYDYLQCYILERHYGGYYSTMDDIVDHVIPKTGFKISDVQDKTKDYHWSSYADPDHFGRYYTKWGQDSLNKITYFFKGLILDPFLPHHWAYYFMDTWMWQFKADFCPNCKPMTDKQLLDSPMLLKYFMLEKTE